MALAPATHYKADLRAMRFTLYDHLKVDRLFALEKFAHLSREECDAVLDQAYRFASEVTEPLNSPGDRAGARFETVSQCMRLLTDFSRRGVNV